MQWLKKPHQVENIIYETNTFHAYAGNAYYACFPANSFTYDHG